ncbi:hypothetical protein CFOL_v3_29441 [Cephalotus follicularis]|uniref:Uncharacterized protein n=1 Tax=Cephalotus follicularis TaxID=3775 RepID=A0A1Q3D0I7_CEPFO|nr:hypothetical protein CFOL_v3_29441 [Cephalotus follicularis]
MGSEYSPRKRHYDITMSKRTRKPSNIIDLEEADENPTGIESQEKQEGGVVHRVEEDSFPTKADVGDQENNPTRLELKQLIKGNEKEGSKEHKNNRSSLGQRLTKEEKQLQVVKKQQQGMSIQGVKLKGMVIRYAKVLGHLIKGKAKPDHDHPSKKKFLRLTLR